MKPLFPHPGCLSQTITNLAGFPFPKPSLPCQRPQYLFQYSLLDQEFPSPIETHVLSMNTAISKHLCPTELARKRPCLLSSWLLQHFIPCKLDLLCYVLTHIFMYQDALGSWWGTFFILFYFCFNLLSFLLLLQSLASSEGLHTVASYLYWDQVLTHRPAFLYLHLRTLNHSLVHSEQIPCPPNTLLSSILHWGMRSLSVAECFGASPGTDTHCSL